MSCVIRSSDASPVSTEADVLVDGYGSLVNEGRDWKAVMLDGLEHRSQTG